MGSAHEKPVASAGSGFPRAMRAAVIHHLGAPSEIHVETLPIPRPGPGELLVRVEFCAVDPVDVLVRSGAYRTEMDFPFVVGRDVVGEVVATGAGAHFRPGQWVWCNSLGHHGRQGGASQFALVPDNRAYPVPDFVRSSAPGQDRAQLLALVHPAATAYLAIAVHGKARPGQTVLVEGGGGNVGSCAIAIAASLGARVVATASASDLEMCRKLGADIALDYRVDNLEELLVQAVGVDTGPNHEGGVAVHLDTSGRNDLRRTVGLLRMGGRAVVISGLGSGAVGELPVGDLYARDGQLIGFAISNAGIDVLAEAARAVNSLFARGLLPRSAISIRPLSDAATVHEQLQSGALHGKRVLLDPWSG